MSLADAACSLSMPYSSPLFLPGSGSFSLGKIADRHAELKEEYDNIVKHVPEFSQYALDGQCTQHELEASTEHDEGSSSRSRIIQVRFVDVCLSCLFVLCRVCCQSSSGLAPS